MGNYADFEREFVQRTIDLIHQYNTLIQETPFERQYNYTLTLNCLLGLIVMPKERALSWIPAHRLTPELKAEMGLIDSILPGPEMTLKDLVLRMRHSIAHFSIEVISLDANNLVDEIHFKETDRQGNIYARFRASEMLPFLNYYASVLIVNLERRRPPV
ncbi:hypothetical protein H2Y56_11320 [Pectobacterium aroidearum]|uniref:pEK499-p136 HEPN domain-containing protein n=1 Tax=Pectobacterium aroidearum TaxID=1201031 RepID=A0ABR5ZDW0_9GAMM|nr:MULTISPECIES: HEPN family nuclease [Pectobacterium]MBA5199908.1 hypothetical protein [Pectobacterium aroidearum]MBA5228100.1 hypothetical protein [Pectobacterium aroidearum]MBA5232700.1 hypothetical protein [Pectobacterium aroidearum]MBA5737624.1 hypothetical protein [Pectobacterium aroidearum]UXK01825.1 HEPN family nuclease [Pectobacterium aroidearum]